MKEEFLKLLTETEKALRHEMTGIENKINENNEVYANVRLITCVDDLYNLSGNQIYQYLVAILGKSEHTANSISKLMYFYFDSNKLLDERKKKIEYILTNYVNIFKKYSKEKDDVFIKSIKELKIKAKAIATKIEIIEKLKMLMNEDLNCEPLPAFDEYNFLFENMSQKEKHEIKEWIIIYNETIFHTKIEEAKKLLSDEGKEQAKLVEKLIEEKIKTESIEDNNQVEDPNLDKLKKDCQELIKWLIELSTPNELNDDVKKYIDEQEYLETMLVSQESLNNNLLEEFDNMFKNYVKTDSDYHQLIDYMVYKTGFHYMEAAQICETKEEFKEIKIYLSLLKDWYDKIKLEIYNRTNDKEIDLETNKGKNPDEKKYPYTLIFRKKEGSQISEFEANYDLAEENEKKEIRNALKNLREQGIKSCHVINCGDMKFKTGANIGIYFKIIDNSHILIWKWDKMKNVNAHSPKANMQIISKSEMEKLKMNIEDPDFIQENNQIFDDIIVGDTLDTSYKRRQR